MPRRSKNEQAPSEPDQHEIDEVQGVVPDEESPQTLDGSVSPRRGIIDRMLRPGKGMTTGSWSGRPYYSCPDCGQSTFNPETANKHHC